MNGFQDRILFPVEIAPPQSKTLIVFLSDTTAILIAKQRVTKEDIQQVAYKLP